MSKFIELNGEIYKRIDDLEEEKPSLKNEVRLTFDSFIESRRDSLKKETIENLEEIKEKVLNEIEKLINK